MDRYCDIGASVIRQLCLDYFSKERSKDPRGALSSKILPSTIAAANAEVLARLVNHCRVLIYCISARAGIYNFQSIRVWFTRRGSSKLKLAGKWNF